MDTLQFLIDVALHLDRYLVDWANVFGPWLYVILFVVVFCETGLVVTPFLPGDSLLFATGAVAALEGSPIHVVWTMVFLVVAAVLGDAVNYAVGHRVGASIIAKKPRWLNMSHVERTEKFYARHGGKTIIIARFAPIIRTFAPFVAGLGRMTYRRFALFNVVGGVAWVVSFVIAGYLFGQTAVVKRNFQLVILAIIAVSLLPVVVEVVRARRSAQKDGAAA